LPREQVAAGESRLLSIRPPRRPGFGPAAWRRQPGTAHGQLSALVAVAVGLPPGLCLPRGPTTLASPPRRPHPQRQDQRRPRAPASLRRRSLTPASATVTRSGRLRDGPWATLTRLGRDSVAIGGPPLLVRLFLTTRP